jgi:MAF protein
MSLPVILLASNSPRRRELLTWTGWPFNVVSVTIDETPLLGEKPENYVRRLAEIKARAVNNNVDEETLIIAADTTVAFEDSIMGKPVSPADARQMLQILKGRVHQVLTGLAVIQTGKNDPMIHLCTSTVSMRHYTDKEIETYIASGDPLDKAGSYAIQHKGFHPVVDFEDCYANVVGFPLCHLARIFKVLGYKQRSDIPAICLNKMGYSCSIFRNIL